MERVLMGNQLPYFPIEIEGIASTGSLTVLGEDGNNHLVCDVTFPPDENGISIICRVICDFHEEGTWTPPKSMMWSSLSDGEKKFAMLWESAVIQKEGNPLELRYEFEGESVFTLVGVNKCSQSHLIEMHRIVRDIKDLYIFDQQQHGGRKKGRWKDRDKILKYNLICNLRYSPQFKNEDDELFLLHNPSFSRATLNNAKEWYKAGRPGLIKSKNSRR